MFKNADLQLLPIFVAKDLERLPPVTFDSVDATALLKSITLLKSELTQIKNDYVTKKHFEDLECKLYDGRYASLLSGQWVNTKKRGTCVKDSGPMALGTPRSESCDKSYTRPFQWPNHATNDNECALSPSHPSDEPVEQFPCESDWSLSRALIEVDNSAPSLTQSNKQCSNEMVNQILDRTGFVNNKTEQLPVTSVGGGIEYAKSAGSALVNKRFDETCKLLYDKVVPCKDSEYVGDWKLVQRKRLKDKFIGSRGKAVSDLNSKFRAADTKIPLFVSNVHKDVLESDITDYIYEKTREKVSLLKIKMKKQRDYNSYKIFVSKNKIEIFLDDNLWPAGISFRRFVNMKDGLGNESSPKRDFVPETITNG